MLDIIGLLARLFFAFLSIAIVVAVGFGTIVLTLWIIIFLIKAIVFLIPVIIAIFLVAMVAEMMGRKR